MLDALQQLCGPSALVFNGSPLALKSMFLYLGMLFDEVGDVDSVAHRCLASVHIDMVHRGEVMA